MILDQHFKDGKLTISYTTPQGSRKFFETSIARFNSWVYDENGKYDTWNGRKCSPTYHDKPNKFDIMEFILKLPKGMYNEINALNKPKMYACDIETDIGDGFPSPDEAPMPITTISLCSPDLSVMVLGTKELTETEQVWCKQQYFEYLDKVHFYHTLENVRPSFQYVKFDNEHDMLEYFLSKIVARCCVLAGWNFLPFDWFYIVNRVRRYKDLSVHMASPRRQITMQGIMFRNELVKIPVPRHVCIFDYMELTDKLEKSFIKESLSLDWIAGTLLGVQKIKYDGSLKQLYNNDYPRYVFYNGIDSVLVQMLDKYMKILDVLYAYSNMTGVALNRCLSPVELSTALVFRDFYDHDLHVVWDDNSYTSEEFEGGYVRDPIVGKHNWVACNDFASLYPSAITSTNISFENVVGDWHTIPMEKMEEYKKDPNYFVTLNNVVYRNDKDYAFKRIQIALKKKRDGHKYFAQHLETELITFVDNLIEAKKKEGNV